MNLTRKESLRVMISTGHLGTAPSGIESFMAAMESRPDYLVADGGSSDPGPVYLGENIELGHFVDEELELFLVESRKRGIPLVIGSAGDSGSNHGVDSFVARLKAIALRHRIPKFRIGYFYSEIDPKLLVDRLNNGETIRGLGGFPDLTAEDVTESKRIVGVAGVGPFLKLLQEGVDVIVAGRCGDINFTAAPCIHAGFPAPLAYHMGKMIECASLVAEPFMGKETIVGTITQDAILLTPFHPSQRCTIASAAGHSMYERETPYFERTVGGTLDMRNCHYEEVNDRECRISGAAFIPEEKITVKLEGARKLGERYMGLAATRDPYVIANIDKAIEWSRSATAKRFGKEDYQIFYHVFGRDGILGEMEPRRGDKVHEVAVGVEVLCADEALCVKITDLAVRMFFLARIPGVKGTSGAAATSKLPMKMHPGYVWSVNHVLEVNDPDALFPTFVTDAGV
jgi:hypothetical protein